MLNITATKPNVDEHAPYYSKYIDLVSEDDVVATLGKQLNDTLSLLRRLSPAQADFRYAPDKWSVKELLGHVIDTERIFAYRALRFARNDQTPLSGFEQDDYVRAAEFGKRELSDLIAEFQHVRQANLYFFRSLEATAWLRHGKANDDEVSVRALAYIIAGHELHHMQILRTRYLQAAAAGS